MGRVRSTRTICQLGSLRDYKNLGFDLFLLANNHAGDKGFLGFTDTIKILQEFGIAYVGIDNSIYRTASYVLNGIRIGVLNYIENERTSYISENTTLCHGAEERFYTEIKAMKGMVNVLIVVFHFGNNYDVVTPQQRRWSRIAIGQGADIVLGHHPHVVQDIEIFNSKPIMYSLGNFIYGPIGRFKKLGKKGYGIVVRLMLRDFQLHSIELTIIFLDNRVVNFHPYIVTKESQLNDFLSTIDLYGCEAKNCQYKKL
eukprot:TRINITY_DN5199_c0_g1_i2.p1 TRINITY_DN5199_c0_g1~~TRINITY_DN5199_c0_g1_i2.p1  ORF type:complete len:256 (-),score=31.65 TRINITY_DN5199_c0_g1_i2:138-905(-)